jgi:preprotein translocase subunit SecA
VLTDLLRLGEGRIVGRLESIAARVMTLSEDVEQLGDAELRSRTAEFKALVANGKSLEALLPEAFAVAREAAWRVLEQRPFGVQIMGGAALHFGNIAEMGTGEGKTLACVMPAYLNALSGNGVHIVTVNDYLAKRDSDWMGRVHRFLGLEVGVILSEMKPDERRTAYGADITYGTNNEFGFDYLRDNMAYVQEDMVQRGHNFAIVDEVDSILIDEARTPLIISGPADEASEWYGEFARITALMEPGRHFAVDLRKRTVGVTEAGVRLVEDQIGARNLYQIANTALVGYLNNALKAKALFECDRDYIVRDGEVLIVDEFTGRVLLGRRYNEGLHQAIEAKEAVEVKAENQTLATITLQNYFRAYDKLAGMTGTAQTEAAEFREIYRLGVITVPPNKPVLRRDEPDVVFKSERAKFDAVVDDVAGRYDSGQPVLIGTTSVEKSEYLSRRFAERGITHTVLNAKHLELEAGIVAEAGRRGSVTVATDMAGRGTDIVLGGNVDFLTDRLLRERGLDPVQTPEPYEEAWRAERSAVKAAAAAEGRKVVELGGLYVVGTERHESRRIDNQLRGRSGRQGDPGETRFYLSLGDDLMRRFSDVNLQKLMGRLKMPEHEPIRARIVSRAIMRAQTQVEQQNFELRKNVLKYDEVMNQQREVIYQARARVLAGEDLSRQVQSMVADVIVAYVSSATAGRPRSWDLGGLRSALETLYPVGVDLATVLPAGRRVGKRGRQALLGVVLRDAKDALARRESDVDAACGDGAMRAMEREVILSVIDRRWREHLYEMDYLKEGIGLRALAQRDPVVEFHEEGYQLFVRMVEAVKEECVATLFACRYPESSDQTVTLSNSCS